MFYYGQSRHGIEVKGQAERMLLRVPAPEPDVPKGLALVPVGRLAASPHMGNDKQDIRDSSANCVVEWDRSLSEGDARRSRTASMPLTGHDADNRRALQ
jgi:hypothetical protein